MQGHKRYEDYKVTRTDTRGARVGAGAVRGCKECEGCKSRCEGCEGRWKGCESRYEMSIDWLQIH